MKKCFTIRFLLMPMLFLTTLGLSAQAKFPDTTQLRFSNYFTTKTLRVDYYMAGNKSETTIYLDQLKQEPNYGGTKKHLIDYLDLGTYRYVLVDSVSKRIIYTRGFSTLFQEWQATPEALTIRRAYPMSAIMPYPLKSVQFKIEKRRFADGKFESIFDLYINPSDFMITRETPSSATNIKFKDSGDPEKKVDVAFIAEGYKESEMSKFLKDAQRIGEYFFTLSPYTESRSKFNFYAILSPSLESGVDNPGLKKYQNTTTNSTFYSIGMDRYLTTSDLRQVYDLAANVPYDVIVILVNSNTYGGGAFFNLYAASTVDNPYSSIVTVHEFGHSFAGLADEYMGDVSYSDLYNLKVEPWEPNITTNIDFASKWKNMISDGTPIPTPRTEQYKESVGMFEGGGYVTKGIYSPYEDCRMKTNEAPGFCPVCQRAIRKMIQFYCD